MFDMAVFANSNRLQGSDLFSTRQSTTVIHPLRASAILDHSVGRAM